MQEIFATLIDCLFFLLDCLFVLSVAFALLVLVVLLIPGRYGHTPKKTSRWKPDNESEVSFRGLLDTEEDSGSYKAPHVQPPNEGAQP